ncbi:hypothetical protein [Halosolutus halophilus]|uniref:hypothetical protein n=1 Tax=Halosolutus halophilus TaxID=1552990 RepID=UPI00223528D3|nr:hypothetical protein [Halosolutus halophilus]
MRIPLPTNRLVALTLAGAVLTGAVALVLAAPGLGVVDDSLTDGTGPTSIADDAPTPNEDFTPAVDTQGGEEREDDEYEEHEEHEEREDD